LAASSAYRDAIKERVHKHGIRVVCLMCSWEGKHRPVHGRLRDRTCQQCGLCRLRPRWWVEKYKTKAAAETKRVRDTSFLIQ
jgi:hypothetical protein